MAETLSGRSVNITETAPPGGVVYTAPSVENVKVRVRISATNIGATLRNLTLVHTLGGSHPNAPGTLSAPNNYLMPIEGVPVEVFDAVIYGHLTTPDQITAYVSGGTVHLSVIAVEVS